MKLDRFTIRKRPYLGESLWGFLFRLSHINGIQILSVINHVRKSKSAIQNSDISLLDFAPESLVDFQKLLLMNNSQDDYLKMTLHYVSSNFSETKNSSRCRYLAGLVRTHYAYCPDCLNEKPYYRLLWRIADLTHCPSHGTRILESCVHCNHKIMFHEVSDLEACPHCRMRLYERKDWLPGPDDLCEQRWSYLQWAKLIGSDNYVGSSNEIALKVLFLLNDRNTRYQKKIVKRNLPNPIVLASILQHARGTLSQTRTLHLSFLLSILKEKRITLTEFLIMKLPDEFTESLRGNDVDAKKNRVSCLAPWCPSFNRKGSLIKTGTTVKTRKNEETMYYYLACVDCGCEYGFNAAGAMEERTYFIQGYNLLKGLKVDRRNLRQLKEKTQFTEDKIRRCLAYFQLRHALSSTDIESIEPNMDLVNRVILGIQEGHTINSIRSWDCWDSYFHYLLHRYHPEVMRVLTDTKRVQPVKHQIAVTGRERVKPVIDQLMQNDEDITISNVAEALNVSPETLRLWGCNAQIAEEKKRQRVTRIARMKTNLHQQAEQYFQIHVDRRIQATELYEYIGIGRTVLWRIAPELTSYIGDALKEHNRYIWA